jgi:hypothetical protein
MTIDVRERIQAELFDYQTLVDALGELSFPRDKITDLIRKRIIIRIKKGLYIFGDRYRRHPYSRELLANLIYGPSYVSLDYALDFYGFIPERSEALTSVTLRRSRKFRTPAGLFIYRQIPVQAYQAGMVRAEGDNGQAFLIASPEKALADKIISERGVAFTSPTGMRQYLIESLRIDISNIQSLSLERIDEYAGRYRSRKLRHLGGLVRRLQKSNEGIPYE